MSAIFKNKWFLIRLASFLLIIIAAVAYFVFLNKKTAEITQVPVTNETTKEPQTKTEGFSDSLSDCKNDPAPHFTHEITDFSKVTSLTPPVTVQGDDLKTHGYIHLNFSKSEKVPVYAPVDARSYEGAFYDVAGSGPLYTFFFEVSCQVRFMFDHIAEPVESLKDQLPDTPAGSSQGERFGPIDFKAGELIGYVGFTKGSKNWDLGVYNSADENPYRDKNYEHSDTFRYSNAVCPYEYFDNSLQKKYKKLFTDSYGKPHVSKTNLCADI